MGIFKKGTKPYGIFKYKCPRCHEGDLFKKPFDFRTAFKMKDAMFGLNMSVNAAFGLLIVVLLLLYVTIFRFSRSLWLNLMVKFNPKNMSVKK